MPHYFWNVLPLSVGLALLLTPAGAHQSPVLAKKHYDAAMILVQEGRLDEAVRSLQSALQAAPDNVVVLNALGATLTRQGNGLEAEDYFLKALKISPAFVPARKNLAILYFNLARYDDAKPHLKKLAESPEGRLVAHLFLGMIAKDEGRFQEAAALLKESEGLAREYPKALLAWIRSLYELGHREQAAALLPKLDGAKFPVAHDYVEAAVLNDKFSRYRDALENLEAARRLDPSFPGLDYQRAFVLGQLGRKKEALDLLRQSTSKDPDGRSLNLLAWLAENEGQLEEAIEALRKAIEVEPRVEDHYLDLSLLCVKHGSTELAEEVAGAGLETMPDSYRLLVQQGAILERASKREQAKQAFRKAVSLREDHQLALAGLAATQVFGGETREAVRTLEAAVQKFPDDFYLHYLYGYALEASLAASDDKAAISAKAKQALRKAIELNPDFADSYYRLGKLHVDAEPAEAIQSFETALRLDPADHSSMYQLARLYMKTGRQQEGRRLMQQVRQAKADKLEEERKPSLAVVRGSRPAGL